MLGWEGWWTGDADQSLTAWEEFRRVAHDNGYVDREIIALTLLARRLFNENDATGVADLLAEGRRLAEESSNRFLKARVDRALGVAVEFYGPVRGVDESAEQLLESAAAVLEEFGDRQELNIALNHLGDMKRRERKPAEALALYERAMSFVQDHAGYRPEAQRRVAQAALEVGDVQRAEREAEEAVATVAPDDYYTVSSTAMALGLVRDAQGRTEEAEQLLRKSVELIEGRSFGQGEARLNLALFLLRHGRPDGAAVAANARAELSRLGPRSPLIGPVNRRLAEAAAAGERQ
jgi:tetratricopeptide (TPR) repeat protein